MKKRLFVTALASLCGMFLLTSCGVAAAKKPPELSVDEAFFAYRNVPMDSLGEDVNLAVEQNGFQVIPVVDGRALAAFPIEQGEGCCHVEGYLGALIRELPKSQTPEELAEKLTWLGGTKLEAVEVENTADGSHVGKECIAIALDTDGDNTLDAVLEVAVKDGTVGRKNKARLIWTEAEA